PKPPDRWIAVWLRKRLRWASTRPPNRGARLITWRCGEKLRFLRNFPKCSREKKYLSAFGEVRFESHPTSTTRSTTASGWSHACVASPQEVLLKVRQWSDGRLAPAPAMPLRWTDCLSRPGRKSFWLRPASAATRRTPPAQAVPSLC